MTSIRVLGILYVAAGLMTVSHGFAQQSQLPMSPATPAELVATYDGLATVILAAKNTEENLVRSILSTSYAHANAARARAQQALTSGNMEAARPAIDELAAHVAQLGSEGDNAVAGVRKRLVEGGHHHHASGESQGVFDPGFVVVTRDAKRQLLEASRELAQLSRAPNAQALSQAWEKVEKVWNDLAKKD
jgi:hypothetical protein